MNESKVWLVLGAEDGLGAAAVKYLTAKHQKTVALIVNETPCIRLLKEESVSLQVVNIRNVGPDELNHLAANLRLRFGTIHTIINNLNYLFFNRLPSEGEIENCVSLTTGLLKMFIQQNHTDPLIHLINVPPQLCLATLPDAVTAQLFLQKMDGFLGKMRDELSVLH